MSGRADMVGVLHAGVSCGAAIGTGCVADDARRRGAVLLEVIVSLGLLVFGMSVVGVQINSALQAARSVGIDTRAMMLTDTLLGELDAGMIRMDANDDEVKAAS
jgi:hypothetical protein